jgi:integrase
MLRVLRKVEARGLTDTVKRTRTLAGRIFRWGVAHGKCSRDPTQDIRDAFVAPQVKHHAALTDPRQVGELLRAIEGYQGQPATRYALRLLPLVFLRSAELRGARWSEIDLEGATWRVPGSRMKMGDEHVVPLATQAVALLRELQGHTGHGELLFPSLVSKVRPISENTLNGAIKRLGYRSDQQTPHGFRTIASTLLNEQGFSPDLIELQLAHQERNQVRAAYNRAQRLEERRAMMQRWADYIDSLRG